MNTIEIYSYIINDPITSKFFIGVFSRDEIPKTITKKPCCFIVNTDNRNDPGSHWLAIFYDANRNAVFFDSYGLHPSHYQLNNYLDRTANNWVYNNNRIQSFFSLNCGHFCILFLYFTSRGYNLKYIQELFFNNYSNEKIVLSFLKFI